jgi:phage gpG-like protein
MKLRIETKPHLNEVRATIDRLRRGLVNMRIPMKKASIQFERWVHHNFETQGQLLGSDKWPEFALGGRPKKGGGIDFSAMLLQDTRRLRASYRPFSSRNNAGIGSRLDYALIHTKGAPSRGLPARRQLPTHREVMPDVIRVFGEHMVKQANERGKPRKNR